MKFTIPILLIMIVGILGSCEKEDSETETWISRAPGTYRGDVTNGGANCCGLQDGTVTTSLSGDNVKLRFFYGDETGYVELLATDLYYWGTSGEKFVAFKINEQEGGEKLKHKFTGQKLGTAFQGFPDHHGFFRFNVNQSVDLILSMDMYTHFKDQLQFGMNVTKN
jgi:hypothetical protein